jgi:hypothetical protein
MGSWGLVAQERKGDDLRQDKVTDAMVKRLS